MWMETPSRRFTRGGRGGEVPVVVEATSTPSVARNLTKKTNTKPTKPKAPETLEVIAEETPDESNSFDGHATMRAGQLSAAKRKHSTISKAVYTEVEFEKELERRCDEIASKISDDCVKEVDALKEAHQKELNELRSQFASAATARPQSSALKWSNVMICKYLIYLKVHNLNDGHSSSPTNKTIHFDVSKEELALCLHCFSQFRDPEICIFKKGRTGSFRHRKPKSDTAMYSKCVKPGVPDLNDDNHYKCRHIHGKDYLLFRYIHFSFLGCRYSDYSFPVFFPHFRFPNTGQKYTIKAANNTRPTIEDPVTKKHRNMNAAEYKLHRARNKEKRGPCWTFCPTHNIPLLGDELDDKADFRTVLEKQWEQFQYDKGWDLGEAWSNEEADYYGPGDKKIEDDERRKKNIAEDSEEVGLFYACLFCSMCVVYHGS